MKGYVEGLLSDYPEMIRRRDSLKQELNVLRSRRVTDADIIESMTFVRPDGDHVMTSGPSDKVSKIALIYQDRKNRANREVLRHCREEYDSLCAEIACLENEIENLPAEQQEVMEALVLFGFSWEEAEAKLSMSRTSIQRIRKQAISTLVRSYQKREAYCIHALLG